MKLNIYGARNEVLKTYETETFRLKYRISKKLIKIIDLKTLVNLDNATTEELVQFVEPLVTSMNDLVFEIMLDLFPDLTEEELDNVDTVELVMCIAEALKYVIKLFKAMNGKNQ